MSSPLLRAEAKVRQMRGLTDPEDIGTPALIDRVLDNFDSPWASIQRIASSGPRQGDEELCAHMAEVLLSIREGRGGAG